MSKKILCYIACILLFMLSIIIEFELCPVPQKTLNILFILGLICFYSDKGSEK